MNRSTDQIDELLDLATEAAGCGDNEQALEFLRKASSLAPFRRDVRQMMAAILQGGNGLEQIRKAILASA